MTFIWKVSLKLDVQNIQDYVRTSLSKGAECTSLKGNQYRFRLTSRKKNNYSCGRPKFPVASITPKRQNILLLKTVLKGFASLRALKNKYISGKKHSLPPKMQGILLLNEVILYRLRTASVAYQVSDRLTSSKGEEHTSVEENVSYWHVSSSKLSKINWILHSWKYRYDKAF